MGLSEDRKKLKRLAVASLLLALLTAVVGAAVLWHYFAPHGGATKTVTVPNVLDKSLDEIGSIEGITVKALYQYSDSAKRGEIISQSPAAGSRRRVAEGDTVTLDVTVSLGKRTETVPDVSGVPYVQAAIRLRELGADVVAVPIYEGKEPAGTVISSSPKSGERINAGDRVVIYVKRNRPDPSVRVPELVGRDVSDATVELLSLGLTVGEITYIDGSGEDGTVVAQSIASGVIARGGETVDLTVIKNQDQEDLDPHAWQDDNGHMPWWRLW